MGIEWQINKLYIDDEQKQYTVYTTAEEEKSRVKNVLNDESKFINYTYVSRYTKEKIISK